MGKAAKKKTNGTRRVAAPRKSPWAELKPGPANYTALSPIVFLPRAAEIYPERVAVIHGDTRLTYRQWLERSTRLASALKKAGVRRGDVVSAMLPNIPAMLEAHHGVPAIGAVLNTINTRLDSDTVAYILEHGAAKVFITDRVFAAVVEPALKRVKRKLLVIDVDDPQYSGPGERVGSVEYEEFIRRGSPDLQWDLPHSESDPIALNYTSGTTGRPKGVVYHHRGTFLESCGNVMAWAMPAQPVYLWTLPMFHCNGWCFPWSVTAMAGTHVCLRAVEPKRIFELIVEHNVTHMCGAPTVLSMLISAPENERRKFAQPVHIQTGGSPPPAKVIQAMEELGFKVLHIYGMTELQGPSTLCAPQEGWDDRYTHMARQGVRYPVVEGHIVGDPKTCKPVKKDGTTIGEILVRGNTVMLGYLKDPKATADAFSGGWMHTGDLAVWHPENYIEIKDRKKDIIISGGENISSVEVEIALYKHPATQLAAVVARPDEKWGETPCAFIQLKPGAQATEAEYIDWCRQNLARFKIPRKVVFGPVPTTATGKIQKYVLRERAKTL
ncbi:MAG TPA: acyl-CoA synthetase [Burkholderiales bacterium]|nr:acyl-CoA synthetase [Burkholderiales bacterium]